METSGLWQRAMIALARSARAKMVAGGLASRTALAGRFVGGSSAREAIETARRLRSEHGISASLFCLGEYVSDPIAVERTVSATIKSVELLGANGLDVHVSVDPTAIGFMAGEREFRVNARRIAEAVAAQPDVGRRFVMLDMEDLSLVEPTLRVHAELLAAGLPAAVTVQARLRRSEHDLGALLGQPTAVRLIKGAFPLGAEHDHQGADRISEAFLTLARQALAPSVRSTGMYPVFATHDERLAQRVIEIARHAGWRPGEYEFEMLYGVRPRWQRQLRARGEALRLYLPFGTDWWPYAVRRAGENPRNLLLLGRSLLQRS